MRLGLRNVRKPFKDSRDVWVMDGQDLQIIDLETGDQLNDYAGMLWCDGAVLLPCDGSDGLLTPDHVSKGKSYLVVVVECESAVDESGIHPRAEES